MSKTKTQMISKATDSIQRFLTTNPGSKSDENNIYCETNTEEDNPKTTIGQDSFFMTQQTLLPKTITFNRLKQEREISSLPLERNGNCKFSTLSTIRSKSLSKQQKAKPVKKLNKTELIQKCDQVIGENHKARVGMGESFNAKSSYSKQYPVSDIEKMLLNISKKKKRDFATLMHGSEKRFMEVNAANLIKFSDNFIKVSNEATLKLGNMYQEQYDEYSRKTDDAGYRIGEYKKMLKPIHLSKIEKQDLKLKKIMYTIEKTWRAKRPEATKKPEASN